jgi:phosphate-selective porin OprO/OprP
MTSRMAMGAMAALVFVPAPAMAEKGGAEAELGVAEAEELRSELRALKAQMARIEARLGMAPPPPAGDKAAAIAATAPAKAVPETSISWKGSPVFSNGSASFKVKGRIQYDAGVLLAPASVDDKAKGYSNELRRLRLGGEGVLGGGFGYKLETELSDNGVDLVDTFIIYEKGRMQLALGNQNQFQSLDELIGDTTGSVMERAAFTDAFAFERRLGLSMQYRKGVLLAQAGLFSDSADSLLNAADGPNGGDENDSYGVDGRIVLAPKFGGAQLHVGGSAHWRDFNRLAETPQRYRQRPYLHSVNSRYLATPALSAIGETHYGLELAGTYGPLYWAGETHWLRVQRPGLADPTFFGAYAEVGYFLTGETRAYKNGIFASTKPKRPMGGGGMGSVQVTLRYDHLDMNDRGIVGGKQDAAIAAIIWTPIEFLRFNLNYGHLAYRDAAIAAGARRDYSVDVIGWRAELDF